MQNLRPVVNLLLVDFDGDFVPLVVLLVLVIGGQQRQVLVLRLRLKFDTKNRKQNQFKRRGLSCGSGKPETRNSLF